MSAPPAEPPAPRPGAATPAPAPRRTDDGRGGDRRSDNARDLLAGATVFLIALPLCLGIALASDAPMSAGLIAGVVGGVVTGFLSGSHTSVSGPAAGLAAIVAVQIATLGSFETFLAAVVVAGAMQIALGALRAGFLASFFPSSVIHGLLAAIGILLVLKQVPNLIGLAPDAAGAGARELLSRIHPGALLLGLSSLATLIAWKRSARLERTGIPAPLATVAVGMVLDGLLELLGSRLAVGPSLRVAIPALWDDAGAQGLVRSPDRGAFGHPGVLVAGFTLAMVASLETLLNLSATDKLDARQRRSPPDRELIAQGVGNLLSGLLGGLPITSVIVRSSVSLHAGARSKRATMYHGLFLLAAVLLVPGLLRRIPLASLAAILLWAGAKLASPALFRQAWRGGREQLLPFAVTATAIVTLDLLLGILFGLGVCLALTLRANHRVPVRQLVEHHPAQDVLRLVLANHIGFFTRPRVEEVLAALPSGGHVLLDARNCEFLDPDVRDLLHDFCARDAPARGIQVSRLGLEVLDARLPDGIVYTDHAGPEVQARLTADEVIARMTEGNARFRAGRRLTRDPRRPIGAAAAAHAPLAVVLTCADSPTPVELLFDMGPGDLASVRTAGALASEPVLASIELSAIVCGAKLVVVLGHTSCRAVATALDLAAQGRSARDATGCEHLDPVVRAIQAAAPAGGAPATAGPDAQAGDEVARALVADTLQRLRADSAAIRRGLAEGRLTLVGALYDVRTGDVTFFPSAPRATPVPVPPAT